MSVYKRGGVYWYDFWFQGQRYRQSTGLNNKTVALRAEAIRKAELAEGRAGIVKRRACPTFESFVEKEFLPWSASEHRAHPNTYKRYKVSSKPLIAFFGKYRLDAILPGLVEKFKLTRSDAISGAGTNRDLAALRFMLNFAVRQEYLAKNPVSGVRFLSEGPGSMRVVSHEEQQKYLAAASRTLQDVAKLILETGMRPEEIFTIRSENVHLAERYLFVPNGKTLFAKRNILLTDLAIDVLKRRLAAPEGPYLFANRKDANRPMVTVQKCHETALRTAKISPGFRLYDLRHTFGSRSAMAGVDLATLKELMGHSNISITMRYVHPTPEHKREAVQKLERYNTEQVFATYEKRSGSPQKSPQ
ncbi:MAG TPA: tyrosine-type recombinase/integrase [Terriglobales bacterium]|nr:tyrosine-type recombinase/integrase [Terriglobales bacterium]